MNSAQKILVTGAGGFIGHHLVTRLKQAGHWVRGVDIKQPEYATAVGLVLFGPRGEASSHPNGPASGTAFPKPWTWFTPSRH